MEEVQKYECLYNKYSKDFKDSDKKSNAWNAVVSQFHDLSQSEAIRVNKLKNIRSAYTRFLKRKKSALSGSGRDAKKQILFSDPSDSSDQMEITWSFGYFGSLEYFTQLHTNTPATATTNWKPGFRCSLYIIVKSMRKISSRTPCLHTTRNDFLAENQSPNVE